MQVCVDGLEKGDPNRYERRNQGKKRLPVSEDPIKVNVICIEDSKYVIDVKYLCRS